MVSTWTVLSSSLAIKVFHEKNPASLEAQINAWLTANTVTVYAVTHSNNYVYLAHSPIV